MHYHWLKLATLGMLRLRMNWAFLGDYQLSPEVLQYMRRTMGRKVHESPDTWVALRQYRDPYLVDDQRGDGAENIRNFERWLYQRDLAPDGHTVATHRIEPPPDFRELNDGQHDLTVRFVRVIKPGRPVANPEHIPRGARTLHSPTRSPYTYYGRTIAVAGAPHFSLDPLASRRTPS
jgi:hypothetical protein